MKTCSNCFRVNDDAAEYCYECGTKFAVWKGAEPLPASSHGKSKFDALFSNLSSMSTPSLACCIAIIHFIIAIVVGIIGFISFWGSALSDSYQQSSGDSGASLIFWEAPVALIQWIAIKYHPQTHAGLNLGVLFFLACIWSAVFGWASAALYKKFGGRKN